jgi:CubicO group peptidase (beta-lactamase class C family)
MKRLTPLVLTLLIVGLLHSCQQENAANTAMDMNRLLMESLAEGAPAPGTITLQQPQRLGFWDKTKHFFSGSRSPAFNPDDQLMVSSFSKMMVTVVALQLVEEGRLNLDHRVAYYLPVDQLNGLTTVNGVGYGPQLQLKHLLSHQSGIRDYLEAEVPLSDCAPDNQDFTPDDRLQMAIALGDARGVPGAAYHYSNTNFVLLGKVIESAEGKDLCLVLRDRIFQPLAMTNTQSCTNESKDASATWRTTFAQSLNDFKKAFTWKDPVGGVASTMEDLENFVRELSTGRIFKSPDLLQSALSESALEDTSLLKVFAEGDEFGLIWQESPMDPAQLRYLIYQRGEKTIIASADDRVIPEAVKPAQFMERFLKILTE